MLGTRFSDTQSRNVVAHSLLWCPDLNTEMVLSHRRRESAVNLVYARSTAKACLENNAEENQGSAAPRRDKRSKEQQPVPQEIKDIRSNMYDAPQPSTSITPASSIFSKSKRAKEQFFGNPRVKQYVDLISLALAVSSVSSLRGMLVALHKLIMLFREKINELGSDELDREWAIPWNSFDGCTITLGTSLMRVLNLLCLRLFYPRCHDVAVLAKFYQLKPLMIYMPISAWLDCGAQALQLPLPFQLQHRMHKPNTPIAEINWSREDLSMIRNICSARNVLPDRIHDEVVCGATNAFMARQLINTHRFMRIGIPRSLNFIGEQLLGYNDGDFVEDDEVIELPSEAPPNDLLNAEVSADVPRCFRLQGPRTPISLYSATSERVLREAPQVIEGPPAKQKQTTTPDPETLVQQFKSSYVYVTHEDHKADNTRIHALNAFIKHRRMNHISMRDKSWQRKACAYCCGEIFSCDPKLVCDQCCLPVHQKCAPILQKSHKKNVIHHGDTKYSYMCIPCSDRNTWLSTAVKPEFNHDLKRSEMLVLHPRTLMDTCMIGIMSLMALNADKLEFPITDVWSFLTENWHDVKPVPAFRNVNVENDDEEGSETMNVDAKKLTEADFAEIKKFRAPFKAVLVTHPAFVVDLKVNRVSFSACMFISMLN